MKTYQYINTLILFYFFLKKKQLIRYKIKLFIFIFYVKLFYISSLI